MAEFINRLPFKKDHPDLKKLNEAREVIAPFVRDPAKQIAHFCKDDDMTVLFEGAQGTMLDIDYGTYPFVTSSHTVAAYAPVGAGVSHRLVGDVIGITKAYTTRVGPGPFPTAMDSATDNHVRSKGGEFGATTGRSRKCGWLDLVALKRAVKADQIKHLAVTKLDVLEKMDEIKLCTTYELDGKIMSRMPYTAEEWNNVKPHYARFSGFDEIVPKNKRSPKWKDLHPNAVLLLDFIANFLDVKICMVGTGPERGQEILVYNPLEG
jgi:adenylosuccinate synthase